MKRKLYSYPCHVITLPDTLRRVKPCFHRPAFANSSRRNFPQFRVVMQDGVHTSNGYSGIGSYLSHSQAAVFHNHLFHSRNHVFRSASAWPSVNCRTHEHTFFTSITPSSRLTQLLMNFDGFHVTQVEELGNHMLLFECKRRHFQYLKHYCHSTTSQALNA